MYRVLAKDGQLGSMTGRSGFHSGSSVIISESGPACMSMSRVDVMAIAINDFSAGSNTKCHPYYIKFRPLFLFYIQTGSGRFLSYLINQELSELIIVSV